MKRIAIISHTDYALYVEDLNEKDLKPYGGDIQRYIEKNYDLEEYSWDYIIDAQYFPESEKTPIEINFEDIGDI